MFRSLEENVLLHITSPEIYIYDLKRTYFKKVYYLNMGISVSLLNDMSVIQFEHVYILTNEKFITSPNTTSFSNYREN